MREVQLLWRAGLLGLTFAQFRGFPFLLIVIEQHDLATGGEIPDIALNQRGGLVFFKITVDQFLRGLALVSICEPMVTEQSASQKAELSSNLHHGLQVNSRGCHLIVGALHRSTRECY